MNFRLKRALSILLAVAMMASLLIVPAAAADQAREWDLSVQTVTVQNGSGEWEDLKIDATASGAKWAHNGQTWTQVNKDTIIKVPVQVPDGQKAIVTLTAYAANTFTVDDLPNKSANVKEEFVCAGTDGWVTIVGLGGQGYLSYIGVRYEAAELPASLTLSSSDVRVKMGETATVTADVVNGTMDTVTAQPENTGVVTATVDGGTITLHPEAKGTTTVNVEAQVKEGGSVTGSFKVRVLSDTVGEVSENTTYNFYNIFEKDESAYYEDGLEWDGLTLDNMHGPNGSNGSLTVHIPDGKKADLTVTTCCYGAGGTVTPDKGQIDAGKDTSENNNGTYGKTYTITGATGATKISFSSRVYVHELKVGAFSAIDGGSTGGETTGTVKSVTISGDNTVAVGGTIDLTAAVTMDDPDSSYSGTVTWTSSDPAVATVSGGKVTGVSVGSASITATAGEISSAPFAVSVTSASSGGDDNPSGGEDDVIAEGTLTFDWNNANWQSVDLDAIPGFSATGFTAGANNHGLQTSGSEHTITLNLKSKATIGVQGCIYGSGVEFTMTSSSGKVTTTTSEGADGTAGKEAPFFTVEDAEGKTTLTFTGSNWIHSIKVEYEQEAAPPVDSADKRIEVWDLAGKLETDTDLYTNHITSDDLIAASYSDGSGKFLVKGGTIAGDAQNKTVEFDGVTFAAGNSDRFYSSVPALADYTYSASDAKYIGHDFGDGYVSAGGIFTNGGGSATRRNLTISGVKAGDTVVVYVSNNQSDTIYTVDELSGFSQTVKNGQFDTLTFIAPKAGSYKVRGDSGKPAYLRVAVIPPVTVSGSIDLPDDFDASGWELQFTNTDTKEVTKATVTGGTYTVELAPGHTYNASLKGANGWGMTNETKQVAPEKEQLTTGVDHDLVVEAKSQYTYSGTIEGFADGYDTSKLVITMVPDEESQASGFEEVELTLTGMSFTALLDPSVVYTLKLEGVNDYQIKTPDEVVSEGDAMTGQKITVEPRPLVSVSGKFVILDEDDRFAPLYDDSTYESLDTVTALSFKNEDDGYTYAATVTADGYTANLRAGAYEAVATVDGYRTKGHVVVEDKTVAKDLLFVSTATPDAVEYVKDIYVDGVGGTENHFKTVTGALAFIKRMTRTDAQRVTVHIAPGTYREQISIDSKNVTFVNDTPNKEAKLTWYYGIGYTYYSASGVSNLDSWYDAEKAFDRYSKPSLDVARWGCTVRVQAPGFQAENITFENSFNYYLTEEELADGVECGGFSFVREYGADVTSKAATERAAAIWVDTNNGRGDMTEFKNCKFLSSQDTFGTGKRMYLKDCYIEGMTDYICGPGDVVFDTCTLNWKGYSDNTTGGYVTAPQTGASETGYLFRSCYITGDTDLKLGAGYLGRTWGAENTGCIYLNTTLQSAGLIAEPTWGSMQGFDPANAKTKIKEWGTVLLDGTAVDLSKRQLQNTVYTSAPTIDVKGTYFKDWTPEYYTDEVEGVALAAAPTVTDNGDINLPRHGHTLTVIYTLSPEANNANDASTIEWYRVAADGTETLVKKTVNAADKTYYIQEDDAGCHIMVKVTPKTIGGQTGTAMSYTVPEAVAEGFDDPTGKTDPVLGAGVNVYLAGDSTVMDYSAAGMHNSGKMREEGSWGEWLQQFFNDKATIVNYAKGGRTTRQFIEDDGFLDEIDATMKEGDFLFIQFGHNDCYTSDSRYVPLGIAAGAAQKSYAEGGVYPDTTSDGKTTYTGYLKKYIEVTEKHGATAVLMTPVARSYFTNGKIRPHHDASTDNTNDNEYCKAVKWVYDWALDQGYNVAFQDNFQLTVELFEKAYADCSETDRQTYVKQIFGVSESTHNNKLGGIIEAAVVAQAIQNSGLSIAKAVKAPTQVQGKTPAGESVFTVNGSGVFAAYDMLSDPAYSAHAVYWEGEGQAMFDAIAKKAGELNSSDTDGTVDLTALKTAITAAEEVKTTATGSADGSDVLPSEKWVPTEIMTALTDAIAAAKAVAAKGSEATQEEVTAALNALTEATNKFNSAKKDGTKVEGPSEPADTTALKDAIEAAREAAEAVKVSEKNGSDVSKSAKWVTQDVMDAYNKAIETAQAVADKEGVTEAEIKQAIEDLAAATTAFEAAQKNGTRSSSSSSGSSGASTGKPNVPSTGTGTGTTPSTPSGNVTTSTTSPDGTRTETVTEPDGTRTETVTRPDGTVTETVTEPDGRKKETVTKADGSRTETVTKADGSKTETVKEANGDVIVTATASNGEVVARVELPAVVPALDYKFADVPAGHWAEAAINTMAALNVVKGVNTDGETAAFDMDSNITRGAMAQILFNLSNGMKGKAESFADVAAGAWYTDAVAWAAAAGVVTGYSDNSFGPDDSITREQLAVMLYRYADLLGLSTSASGAALNSFADSGSVSSWSADAMSWAVSNGLIQGKGANNLDPAASASRAETAVILQRFLDMMK